MSLIILFFMFIGVITMLWAIFAFIAIALYFFPTFLEWIFDKIDRINQ